jgi:CubicO group peptidase (beta-lactamase class C family)
MKRRTFLQTGSVALLGSALWQTELRAALRRDHLDAAADVLSTATLRGQLAASVLHVVQDQQTFTRAYGLANDEHAMFLLGSISKPICVTALMTLFDQGAFKLDDPVKKFFPKFTGDGRDAVTIQHLITHTSGLPDQLPANAALRKAHAPLSEFVAHTIRTPLGFTPGTKYQYSSMAILLACGIAAIIAETDILTLVDRAVFKPLGMTRSAQGLGKFKREEMVTVQTEVAAPESGGGDPSAKDWDWNSSYWRALGAPWGGTHCSAPDIAKFLAELLDARGKCVKPETAKLMTTNRNPTGITSRGLGLDVGPAAGSPGCSARTFGHTGSTGTLCWADPETRTICVVLTTLPRQAVKGTHPRALAAEQVAAAAR